MKILFSILLLALIAAVIWIGLGFRAERLPVPETPTIVLTDVSPVAGVKLAAIHAGRMESVAAMAYRGGSFADKREFGMGAILVEHPQGNLLFDTGFGSDVLAQVESLPLLMRLTSKVIPEQTVAEQLAAADYPLSEIEHVIVTHGHWDHISALPDLNGPTVMMTREEQAFVQSGDPIVSVLAGFDDLQVVPVNFSDAPYLGFDSSADLYGDGSVVLVPAPGHTPGALFAFVNTEDGKRYALLGDVVWQREGLELPAERPKIARMLVDHDPARVRAQIVHLHRLQKMIPDMLLVPAHDRRVWQELPQFPEALSQ